MSGVLASPTPRRFQKPSWLDVRLALGVVLVLASVVAGAVVVSRAHVTRPVLVARHDLAAGTVLAAADLDVRRVQISDATAARYAASPDDVVGRQLQSPVTHDEFVPLAATTKPPTYTTITIPFADGTAPSLRAGQRIEVWLSSQACGSIVLLPDVTVQAVQARSTGFGGESGQSAVLNVKPPWASRVVAALDISDAHISAGVLSGTQPPPDPLPDVISCASGGSHR